MILCPRSQVRLPRRLCIRSFSGLQSQGTGFRYGHGSQSKSKVQGLSCSSQIAYIHGLRSQVSGLMSCVMSQVSDPRSKVAGRSFQVRGHRLQIKCRRSQLPGYISQFSAKVSDPTSHIPSIRSGSSIGFRS